MEQLFIGVAVDGKFRQLWPKKTLPSDVRLTSIDVQVSESPQGSELNLNEYEGTAIGVMGHDQGDWIYSASVIDTSGPIVTALVKHVFDSVGGKD